MIYYCKKGFDYSPKNKLQSAVQYALATLDGLLVADPTAFKAYLDERVAEKNAEHPKCAPLRAQYRTTGHDRHYTVLVTSKIDSDVIGFSLLAVVGEFLTRSGEPSRIELYTSDYGKEVSDE